MYINGKEISEIYRDINLNLFENKTINFDIKWFRNEIYNNIKRKVDSFYNVYEALKAEDGNVLL